MSPLSRTFPLAFAVVALAAGPAFAARAQNPKRPPPPAKTDPVSGEKVEPPTKLPAGATSKPEPAKPEAAKPEVAKPAVAKPADNRPDAAKSDAAKSDAAKPDAAKPDAAKPDAAKPDAAKPDAAKPADSKAEAPGDAKSGDAKGQAAAPSGDAKPGDTNTQAAAPAPKPPPKANPKSFDEALGDYNNRNPRVAAGKLFAYLEGTSPTDENYAWAQYFLARSLKDLGLRHGAAYFLSRVARERSNPAVLPRALDELRALVEVPHDEKMIDDQVFGALDLGFLPEETGAFANYQQGMLALKIGNERWAKNHFSKLGDSTSQASRAKFAVVVTRLREAKEITSSLIDDFLALSKDPQLDVPTRNEAMLAVARLRYEKKDFTGALEAYGKVQLPSLDPGRASLYLEEAWTRYQMGQHHAAMGLLTTLDAPSFRNEFLPDKYLLRALIYRDLCHYLPAKRAAKELTRRFADSLDAIHERSELTGDPRLRRAAMSHGGTKRSARFLESLQLESERISRYSGGFGERLVAYLTKLYDLAQAESQRLFQERLEEGVRLEAAKLLRAAEQVRLMEYEVGLKLYERVKKGSKLATPEKDLQLESNEVAFPFDGEYWNDELRDYRFSLQNRCIEETIP